MSRAALTVVKARRNAGGYLAVLTDGANRGPVKIVLVS
jgi:hypothetical protein